MSYCVLIHPWLPGTVLRIIFSAMLWFFQNSKFCEKLWFIYLFNFFSRLFFCFLSALCRSCCLSIFFSFSLFCMMTVVALLIISSPPSLIRWEALSQLHLLCSLPSSLVYSFLSLSCWFPLSVYPLPSPLSSIWWWMSLHQLLLSKGLWGLWCQRTQRTVGQAKPSKLGAH